MLPLITPHASIITKWTSLDSRSCIYRVPTWRLHYPTSFNSEWIWYFSSSRMSYPEFKDLPLDKNGPHGNAWGLWGPNDQIGTLNHLTDEVVSRAAREEIRTGQRVSLKWVLLSSARAIPSYKIAYGSWYSWSLTGPSYPRFPRKILDIKTINKAPLKHAHDDEVHCSFLRVSLTQNFTNGLKVVV